MDPKLQALYTKYGVSPDTHDFDPAAGKFRLKAQPATAPTYRPLTPLGTFGQEVIQGVIPAVGSSFGGGVGLVAGAPAGPVGMFTGGISGGIAGGVLADEAQDFLFENLMPEQNAKWRAQVAANRAANPKSAFAGQLVSGLAGNKLALGRNLLAARSLFQPGALSAPAKQTLLQAGANTGIGAGLQTAQDAIDPNQDVSLGRSLAAGAANVALGAPRKLIAKPVQWAGAKTKNPKMVEAAERLTQDEPTGELDRFAEARPFYDQGAKVRPVPDSLTTTRTQLGDLVNPESTRKAVLITNPEFNDPLPAGVEVVATRFGKVVINTSKVSTDVLMGMLDGADEFPATLLGMSKDVKPGGGEKLVIAGRKGAGETTTEVVDPNDPADIAAAKTAAENASPGATVEEKPAAAVVAERASANPEYVPPPTPDRAGDFARARAEETLADVPSKEKRPLRGKLWNFVHDLPNRTQLTEENRPVVAENPAQPQPDTDLTRPLSEAEQIQEDYDAGRRFQKDDKLPKPKYEPKISEGWYNYWKQSALRRYLATTSKRSGIKTSEGKPARGGTDLDTRHIDIDPALATYDTQPHEVLHLFFNDILVNGTEGEKQFVKRFMEAAGDEERAVQAAGEAFEAGVKKAPGVIGEIADFVRYKLGGRDPRMLARLGAQMLARGRTSAEIGPGNTPKGTRNQPVPYQSDALFATDAEKEFSSKENPYNLRPGKTGTYNVREVEAALGKLNSAEREMLGAVLDDLKGRDRIGRGELIGLLRSKGPQLEIKELDATPNVSEAELAYNKMTHEWFDSLPSPTRELVRDSLQSGQSASEFLEYNNVQAGPFADKVHEYFNLHNASMSAIRSRNGRANDNDSATAAYPGVNPRELKDMPGAVDILVRVPRRKLTYDRYLKEANREDSPNERAIYEAGKNSEIKRGEPPTKESPIYPASNSHYPKSGDNLLTHVRAYEHTLPDGRRVLRVFEVQSDWAQQRTKQLKEIEKTGGNPGDHDLINDHPLHPHTNKLGLKAAMEIARKRGLDGVVLDDAETAMLTEWHDQVIDRARKDVRQANHIVTDNQSGDPIGYGSYKTHEDAIQALMRSYGENGAKFEIIDGKIVMTKEPFVGGMTHNYDGDLQRGARDLSGVEGVPVELGEHKNAVRSKSKRVAGTNTEDVDSMIDTSEWRTWNEPRPGLIFKNPDGSPKTKSTGRFYPLGNAGARRAKGEPFSMTGKRYQADDPVRPEVSARPRLFTSPIDALIRMPHDDYKDVGKAIRTAIFNAREYEGRWGAAVDDSLRALNDRELQAVRRHLIDAYANDDDTLPMGFSPKQTKAVQTIRQAITEVREEANKMGLEVQSQQGSRLGRFNPVYLPGIIDPDVQNLLMNQPGSARARALAQEFIDFNAERINDYQAEHGERLSADDIQSILQAKVDYYSGAVNTRPKYMGNDAASRPLRLAAFTRLPESWIAKDTRYLFNNYFRKVSRDLAQYKNLEQDPRIRALLSFNKGAPDDVKLTSIKGAGAVQAALEAFNPPIVRQSRGRKLASGAVGLANNLLVSNPLTRGKDLVTSNLKGATFTGPLRFPAVAVNAIRSAGRAYGAARRNGLIKPGGQFANMVTGGTELASRGISAFNKMYATATGSELLERASRISAQFWGRGIVDTLAAPAINGDKSALRVFNELGTDWRELLQSQEGRDTLASRIGGHIQGFYDGQNLPSWANTSAAKPFVSLMRWHIEQGNNLRKFQLAALKDGNVGPLLMYIAALGAGSKGLFAMQEMLTGKKSYLPTEEELDAGTDESRVNSARMQKLLATANMTGMLGIVGLFAESMAAGAAGQPVQEWNIPAVEQLNNAMRHFAAATSAAMDATDWEEVGEIVSEATANLARNMSSAWRLLEPVISEKSAQKIENRNAKRDYKVYRRLTGKPQPGMFIPMAGYGSLDEKAFDETQDLGEAEQFAEKSLDRAERKGGEEGRERKLRTLRAIGGGSEGPTKEDELWDYEDWLDATMEPGEALARKRRLEDGRMLRADKLDLLESMQ